MNDETGPFAGVELASAPLRSCAHMLIAMASATTDGDPIIELGTWPVRDGHLARPGKPLLLTPEGLAVARELMAHAMPALPNMTYDDDDCSSVTFGSVDTLLLMAVRGHPKVGTVLSLSGKGAGTAWAPLKDVAAFASVLEKADRAFRASYVPPAARLN